MADLMVKRLLCFTSKINSHTCLVSLKSLRIQPLAIFFLYSSSFFYFKGSNLHYYYCLTYSYKTLSKFL